MQIREANKNGIDNHELIGEFCHVETEISPGQLGKVELRGTQWNAQADTVLARGERVKVVEVRGLTVKVEKL